MQATHIRTALVVLFLDIAHFALAQEARVNVGPQGDGRIVVPTNQVLEPAGEQLLFGGRPTDLALSPDGKRLAIVNRREVLLVDAADGKTISRGAISGASYKGVLFGPEGRDL